MVFKNLYISHSMTVPELSAVIKAIGQPLEGQNYLLTCDFEGDERLPNSTIEFQWHDSSMMLSQSANLSFSPLRRNSSGEYRCTATITSPYLTGRHTRSRTEMLTVTRKLTL